FYIPVFLFAPFFGRVIDNNDRKHLIIFASVMETCFGLLLYASLALHALVLPISFASVFGISTFGFLISTSRGSLIPLTVEKNEITTANSLQQLTTQSTMIFGYLLGGTLYFLLRTGGVVLLDIGAFIASASILSTLKVTSPAAERRRRSLDGVRYIFGNKLYAETTILLAISNFTAAGMTFLPLIMSYDVFHTGRLGYVAVLVTVGVGTMAGNYLCTRIDVRRRTGLLLITANLLDGFFYLFFGTSNRLPVDIVLAFLIGITEGVAAVPFIALLQSKIPAERLGSVLSAMSMFLLAGASASLLSSGFFVDLFGVRNVYIIFASLLLAVSLAGAAMKDLRGASY
ncbi:MAG: MFS transporter, partial [Methanomassiliicoccales archaeon]